MEPKGNKAYIADLLLPELADIVAGYYNKPRCHHELFCHLRWLGNRRGSVISHVSTACKVIKVYKTIPNPSGYRPQRFYYMLDPLNPGNTKGCVELPGGLLHFPNGKVPLSIYMIAKKYQDLHG
jgi:hypothetical protein